MRLILAACALLLAVTAVRADTDLSLREDGVLYFEDNSPNRIFAPVKKPTTLYLRRDFQDALALLVPGQNLELIGMSPEGYIVKGSYRNNAVTGWITRGFMNGNLVALADLTDQIISVLSSGADLTTIVVRPR